MKRKIMGKEIEFLTFFEKGGGQRGRSRMLDYLTSVKKGESFHIILNTMFGMTFEQGLAVVEFEVTSPFPTFDVKVISKNCCVTNEFVVKKLKEFTKHIEYNPFEIYWKTFDICVDIPPIIEKQYNNQFEELDYYIKEYRKAKSIIELTEKYFVNKNIYY